MATRPPNQASGTGTAGNLSADNKHRPVKGKAKNRPAGTPTTPAARWNANKHHTVSYGDHLANVKAKKQLGTTNLTDPPSAAQAITEANSAADLQFGPQVRAAQQGLANVEPWFREHMARIAGYATAAQQRMQPVLDQAGQLADPATAAQTQAAPGLDPNSEAGRASAMAAQGRAALAALGQQALQTNAQSTQDTFAGQGLIAQRELPQAQTFAQGQLANAQSDRGAAVTKFLTDARANAQNYAIARGTLGANIANSAADADAAAARTTETGRHNRASETNTSARDQAAADRAAAKGHEPNKYGVPADQWAQWSTSHRQREIDKYNATHKDTSAGDKKHADSISKSTGKARTDVQDIIDAWKRGASVPAPTDQDKKATRPANRTELRHALGAEYGGTMVSIMERVRKHQPLTPQQVQYLRDKYGPDFRLPREWGGQERGPQGSGGNAPAQGGSRPT